MKKYKVLYFVFSLFIFSFVGVFQVSSQTDSTFTVLNEIEVNNPGSDLSNCEYVEIRGDANTNVPGTLFLLQVEGDGSVAGRVDFVSNLSGSSFGANGLIVVTGATASPIVEKAEKGVPMGSVCGSRDYELDGATVIELPTVAFENGTVSFLLVSTDKSTISVGDDFDTDNNGTIDNFPFDGTIVDAVGWSDGGLSDFVYGGTDITPSTGTPDAATRNFNNILPLEVTAWFADDIVNTGSVDSVLYSQTNLIGGYVIDFITPGRQNLAPNSANAKISGRARFENGQGLKGVVVMLTGGLNQEPIYTTTNQFGNFEFDNIAVGQTYVLQLISGRYAFKDSSRVINVDDNVTDIDFIGFDK